MNGTEFLKLQKAVEKIKSDSNLDAGFTVFNDGVSINVNYKNYVDWMPLLTYLQSVNSSIELEKSRENAYSFYLPTNNYIGSRILTKCDCGYGEGFYHYESDGTHEYNPNVSYEVATALYEVTRKPVAKFYGHTDGRRVVVDVDGKEASFRYCEYGGSRKETFKAAAKSLVTGCG